jgi:endoglucanase
MIHATTHPSEGTVYGLFTRAEEVGLVGARLAAKSGLLPNNTFVLSAETSHTLPGAELGGGVVIRTGDGSTTFDNEAEAYLKRAAAELAKSDPEFKFKRQLMSGGGCEATAFAGYGYQVTGTAFPLGNWHNGLVQKVLEPEQIHMNDFLSGAKLLCRVAELTGTPIPTPAWLRAQLDEEIGRLRQMPVGRA